MSLKKTDLARNLALKLEGRMKAAATPDRFSQGAAPAADKREQRRRDAAAGLVPFACKLPADLVKTLQARADVHAGGINGLVAELLRDAIDRSEHNQPKTATS